MQWCKLLRYAENINHMFCLISVYVDMGLASNAPVTLTVVTNVTDSNTRSFSIKITQIDCLSFSRGISKFSLMVLFILYCKV